MLKLVGLAAFFLLAALALLAAAFFVYGPRNVWERFAGPADHGRYDFARLIRSRTRNDALACTPNAFPGGEPDIRLPTPGKPPQEVLDEIDRRIEEWDGRKERVDDGSDPFYRRYVTWSPLMNFPDTTDIEVLVPPGADSAGIRAYARAQLGREDFGKNAQRLRDWLGVE